MPGLLLGTSFSGRADAAAREAPARASLTALERSGAAVFVDLRFADETSTGVVLRHDARTALAARDHFYFSRWCEYVSAAEQLRARGGSSDEELGLQRAILRPPTLPAAAMNAARGSWWRMKRALGA